MKKLVAEIVTDILQECGITDSFSVVGGGSMHLNRAFSICKGIATLYNHHEQACAMAAAAYARVSGKPACVCVTCGPGGTNTLTGVVGAWQDGLPMVVVAGQSRYEVSVPKCGLDLRYRGPQEFDIVNTVRTCTKYAVLVCDPKAIARELRKAIKLSMSGRRGPVWIDIPLDVQATRVDTDELYPDYEDEERLPSVAGAELSRLREMFTQAERPCIVAGSAIRSCDLRESFLQFIEKLGVPVMTGPLVPDVLYTEHPLFFGCCGSVATRPANFILQNADLILTLGSSLSLSQTGFAQEAFAPRAKVVMVDINPDEAKKPGLKINLFIHSELKLFLKAGIESFDTLPEKRPWLDYCHDMKCRFPDYEGAKNLSPENRTSCYAAWQALQELAAPDAVMVLGNNTSNIPVLQHGARTKDQRVFVNTTCGSMGDDLPAAIGSAVALGREVLCITGDGSVMMNLQELQTIIGCKLPVKILIFSNDGYGAIRNTCRNYFDGQEFGCSPQSGVTLPNFEKLAGAFGYKYISCETNAQARETVAKFLSCEAPVIFEVMQDFEEGMVPCIKSKLLDDGSFATPALQDMFPFVADDVLKECMISEKTG